MKAREIANIVLKAMGIYWLVEGMLHILRGVLMPFSDMGNLPSNFVKIEIINWSVVGAIFAAMSYMLIFRTDTVLRLIKLDEDKEPISSGPIVDLKDLAFALLGMYFLVTASSAIVPQLIKLASLRDAAPTGKMFQEAYLEKSWTSLLEHAIQFAIGVVLVIGRSRLTQVWQRLRPLSTSSEEDTESK